MYAHAQSFEEYLNSVSSAKRIDTLIKIPYDILITDFDKSQEWFTEALEYVTDVKDKAGLLNNKSIVTYYQGKYDISTEEKLAAIAIYDSLGDKKAVGNLYSSLGYQLKRINMQKGEDFMRKGMKLLLEYGEEKDLTPTYNNYGVLKEMQKQLDSALYFYNKSYELTLKIKDSIGIPYALNNMAGAMYIKGNFDEAIKYLKESTKIRALKNNIHGLMENYNVMGNLYFEHGKYDTSIYYFNLSLEEAYVAKYPLMIQDNLKGLANAYEKKGDFEKALNYTNQSYMVKDSLLNAETNKQIAELEEHYESEKKNKEIVKLNAQNQIQKERSEKQNIIIIGIVLGLILVILFLAFVFNRLRITKEQNKTIQEQKEEVEAQRDEIESQKTVVEIAHQEIKDSINYAKRIQHAILPPDKIMRTQLPENFIFYKPKDIVAGDFYWIEPTKEGVLFAAADCTGHGVPGAMVSVVCHNALNRAVREFGLTDPGLILDKTREIVLEEFSKSDEDITDDESIKDGMDIALCSLEFPSPLEEDGRGRLKYAGAYNPLWIVRKNQRHSEERMTEESVDFKNLDSTAQTSPLNDDFSLLETKANKQPIGKFENLMSYTTHTFELQKGDSIYIFSDGYIDQFGGEKDKKFGSKRLKKLLLSMQEKSMLEQKEILNSTLQNWIEASDEKQLDDVCVLGVRI